MIVACHASMLSPSMGPASIPAGAPLAICPSSCSRAALGEFRHRLEEASGAADGAERGGALGGEGRTFWMRLSAAI